MSQMHYFSGALVCGVRERAASIHRAAEKGCSRKPGFRYSPILGNQSTYSIKREPGFFTLASIRYPNVQSC
jgi:hypothetical protein